MSIQLSPLPIQKFFDNNGFPLAFGKLNTYAAGTTTPIATYKDSSGTLNSNPITLNLRGECALWIDSTKAYKFALTDLFGNTIPGWPVDNITIGGNLDNSAVDTGSANSIILTISTIFTLTTFTRVIFKAAATNTGPTTLTVNGVSKSLTWQNLAALAGGEIQQNGLYEAIYDGTQWQLLSPALQPPQIRTAAEISASVTPVNYAYAPGDLTRYGVAGDGSTDDSTAFGNATLVAAQGVQLLGTPGKTYKIDSAVACGSIFDLDLRGATIKPGGNSGRFTSTAATAAATTTVSSGATQGSRSVVVASATGISVGQRVQVSASNFPTFWAKITSVSGTTLEFDRTLPVAYSGTINLSTYSAINDRFRLVNGVFDGANVTGSAGNNGQALKLLSYGRVELDGVAFKNYAPSTGNQPLEVSGCVDVLATRLQAFDNSIPTSVNVFNFTGCRKVVVTSCLIDGSHFGLNVELSETAIVTSNTLSGRRKYEDEESITQQSVRGIKVEGCAYALIEANDTSDYESPIKVEQIHRYVINGNVVRNSALLASFGGEIAINISGASVPEEPYGLVSNNLIENCGGTAIGFDSGGGSTADINAVVSGNVIRNCGRYAVYSQQRKLTVIGNRIQNWNTTSSGSGDNSAAIFTEAGITAIGNTFENSDATDCVFNTNFIAGETYCYRDNARLSANPEFNGSLQITEKSLTINIGSASTTSSATAHGMVRTPSQSELDTEIATTGTTNDPGPVTISAIDATNVTVACRNAPGASTMNVHVKVRIRMPFTA